MAPFLLYAYCCESSYNDGWGGWRSLHSTKAGAYRAMRRALLHEFREQRELALVCGRRFTIDHPHEHVTRSVRAVAVTD